MASPDVATAVIAAGSALAGGFVAQLGAVFLRRGDRKEARKQAKAEYELQASDTCTTAALALRKALLEHGSGPPHALVLAKSEFEAFAARIGDATTAKVLDNWKISAFLRAQGAIGSQEEDAKWSEAARELGKLWQKTLR